MMLFAPSSLVLRSYAKINVSLHVLNKQDDGYHQLEMVFLPLELHDVIELNRTNDSCDSFITCDDIGLANNRHNLCMKALNAMRDAFHFKDQFNIAIHKEIPYAAGLGGGSSNAAAVIQGLNKMLRLHADDDTLRKIALSIGADVPFFFINKPSIVRGIGEQIEPFPMKEKYFCLLIKPKEGLSTKAVYEAADSFSFHHIEEQTLTVMDALQKGDIGLLSSAMRNDLFEPAKTILPVVGTIVEELKAMGLSASSMTGSGSACFSLSKDLRLLKEAAHKFDNKGYTTIITKTLDKVK